MVEHDSTSESEGLLTADDDQGTVTETAWRIGRDEFSQMNTAACELQLTQEGSEKELPEPPAEEYLPIPLPSKTPEDY
jgi:hypothetical protein